jgi:hypothetical protein
MRRTGAHVTRFSLASWRVQQRSGVSSPAACAATEQRPREFGSPVRGVCSSRAFQINERPRRQEVAGGADHRGLPRSRQRVHDRGERGSCFARLATSGLRAPGPTKSGQLSVTLDATRLTSACALGFVGQRPARVSAGCWKWTALRWTQCAKVHSASHREAPRPGAAKRPARRSSTYPSTVCARKGPGLSSCQCCTCVASSSGEQLRSRSRCSSSRRGAATVAFRPAILYVLEPRTPCSFSMWKRPLHKARGLRGRVPQWSSREQPTESPARVDVGLRRVVCSWRGVQRAALQ